MDDLLNKAAQILKNSKHTTVFTGAGISVESGIPPFRGDKGLWSKYDPKYLDISFFDAHPKPAWEVIKEIFYDFFGKAQPNDAHRVIAKLEKTGIVKAIITQNIDNLHQEAGSKVVYEFHGNSSNLICRNCGSRFTDREITLNVLPPKCRKCNNILKPDFIFFGEGIPEPAHTLSFAEAEKADVFLVIGTTGEVMPACMIPQIAKKNGCTIIEINPENSLYTKPLTDIYLKGPASIIMNKLLQTIN